MFWINHTAQGAPLTISGSGGDPPQIHAPRHQPRDLSGAHSLSPAAFTHFCTPTFLVIVSGGTNGAPSPQLRSRLWGNDELLSARLEARL